MLTEQTTEFGIRSKTRVPKTFSLLLYYIVSIISVQSVVENFILVKTVVFTCSADFPQPSLKKLPLFQVPN